MGFHVGIPTLKLSRKVAANASRKRTGTLRSVAAEALEERWSRDPDIDRSRTQYNEYEGIRSGLALAEAMAREAEEYGQKRREAGGRAVRDTASIGFVTIVKPDKDAVNSMTPDERKRFFADSREILDDILGRDNVRARVIHRDEQAEHEHTFRMGYTEDGTLSVDKLVCPKIWSRVNIEYPKKMREKGWDVEDCEMYDAKRAETDPEYREERIARRKQNGRGSSKFKRDAERAADVIKEKIKQEYVTMEADKSAIAEREEQQDKKQRSLDNQQRGIEARAAAQARERRQLDEQREQLRQQEAALNARKTALDAREATIRQEGYQIAMRAAEDALRAAEAQKQTEAQKQAAARTAGLDAIQEALGHAGNVKPSRQLSRQGGFTPFTP